MFLNETMHPEAEDLTNLLFKARGQDDEDRCYSAINDFVFGSRVQGKVMRSRTVECGADLYARIAELDVFTMGRPAAESAVSRVLWANQREFPHG